MSLKLIIRNSDKDRKDCNNFAISLMPHLKPRVAYLYLTGNISW